jgi:hypothetical protein
MIFYFVLGTRMPWYKYNVDLTKNTPYDSPHLNTAQLSGPILPLSFANIMWILYTTQNPDDCKFRFLDFCLVAGCISLITVIIGLACKIMVEDAWADGMLSRQESVVVWLMVNSHHLMLVSQVILFFVFFVYLIVPFQAISYDDKDSMNYCSRQIYLTSLVIATIFCLSCLFAILLILCFWGYTRIGDTDESAEMGEVESVGPVGSKSHHHTSRSGSTSDTDSSRPVP